MSTADSQEKGSAEHRRRWGSLRLYLCGEEMNAAAEEEEDGDGDTVSVKSFETCCVMPEEAHVVVPVHHRLMSAAHDGNDQSRVPGGADEEGAATLIQSAFRGFMSRRQLQEARARTRTRTRGREPEPDGAKDQEPSSPTWGPSVATSVLVQVGDESSSLGNLRLRLSEESASVQQQRSSSQRSSSRPPPAFRVKEEWDDSTVSSNVSRMRIQNRIEATTRRERALAYAFSQQLRSCGGGTSKKRSSARAEGQGEFNVGWSWLERWMATRQAEPADDCASRNADTGSATGRRVVVVRRRSDLAVEEKESCASNDVSVVSFDASSGLACHRPTGNKSRLKGGRSLPRRKQVAASASASDHRFQERSHKVSKKGHQRVEQEPHKDRFDAVAALDDDACQPPTDY